MIAENEKDYCPHCKRETESLYNWVMGDDGKWYHECWECENVFQTDCEIVVRTEK